MDLSVPNFQHMTDPQIGSTITEQSEDEREIVCISVIVYNTLL
jgi:hypothetical protein